MLVNLHYSARRAARKHTDLETEVEILFYYLLGYMYSTGQKISRRRKKSRVPKQLYQGTETDRRSELSLPISCQCDSTVAVATGNIGYFIARVNAINMPASLTLIKEPKSAIWEPLEKAINQGTEGKLKQEKTRYFLKIVVIEYGMSVTFKRNFKVVAKIPYAETAEENWFITKNFRESRDTVPLIST